MNRLLAGLIAATALLAPLAAPAKASIEPPRLDARAWVLIDASDGSRLAERAPDRALQIGSATKLMTARLALENLEPGEVVTAPPYDAGGLESVLGLQRGERVRVRDLVYALILASANDVAAALAIATSGSTPPFVAEMNAESERLGLQNTSFANPIGFDDPTNFSTAADLAELTRTLLESRLFRTIADSTDHTVASDTRSVAIETRNTLLRTRRWVTGVKTGHTSLADYVLVSSARRDGIELISVVLGAPSEAARDAESLRLLQHGFDLHPERVPVRPSASPGSVPVRYEDEELALSAGRRIVVRARRDQELRTEVNAPAIVEGPIEVGERLGRVTVSLDGQRVGSSPLEASRAIAAPSLLDRYGGAAAVMVVALSIALASAAWMGRRRRGG